MAIYSEFSHETWWFSIVMLVYQRVTSSTIIPLFLHHIQPLGPMDLARASRSGTTPSGRATSWGRCWENWRSTWSWAWRIYGFMMVYDGLWWFMMVYDGLWWFMMVYDGLWLQENGTESGKTYMEFYWSENADFALQHRERCGKKPVKVDHVRMGNQGFPPLC